MGMVARMGILMDDVQKLHKLNAWLSPAFPVGAYAYSHGLETVVSSGEIANVQTLSDWLSDVLLHGSGRNDAILLRHAYNAATLTDLEAIADLACALAPSAERHLETTSQGRAFVTANNGIWGEDTPDMPYPVAIGAAARSHEIDLDMTLNLFLHAFVANIISAGVRFIPLGQTEGQKLLKGFYEPIADLAERTAELTLEDLGGMTFRADMASMKHETLRTRIFRS